ncbi:MFS general substrate transporter [Apiospora saccharicola]
MSVIIEVTPFQYIGIATGLLGPTFASSSLLGPLLGGIITTRASWRWVFFVNVPVGLVILCVVAWIFPVNSEPLPIRRRTFSFVDYPGMLLSLLGVVTLIYAIEKGGARQAWSSPDIVATLATSAVAITGFVVWEWLVSNAKTSKIQMLPLFPIRLIQKRVLGSIFLTAFITGFPFMVTNIFLPQRFQLQNELRPIDAGLRMLPLLMMSAVGAGIGGAMVRYWNVSWYILASSFCLQMVALGLMTTLPMTEEVAPAQFGYQSILGLGFGLTLSSITVGAITQIRILGGLIGVAISQAVISELVAGKLERALDRELVEAVLASPRIMATLAPAQRAAAVRAYGEAFNLLNRIAAGMSAAALLGCLGAWRRHPLKPSEITERKG